MLHNEKELIEKCQSGNTEAFGYLYDHYVRTIYNFVFYKTLHKETAEDLTSQTFFKALRNIRSVDTSRSFLSWLYKIAHNSVLDHYRTKRHTEDIDDLYDLSDEDAVDVVGTLDKAEDIKRIKKYLDKLSAIERDIIIMRVWQELPYREIADIVGKSEANCKMMFSRSMKKLRTIIPLALFLLFII